MKCKTRIAVLTFAALVLLSCRAAKTDLTPNSQPANPTNSKANTYGDPSAPGTTQPSPSAEVPMMDECLIGEWVTESIHRNGYDESPDSGAGVHVTFERDGRMTVDHDGMSPIIEYMGYDPKRIAKTTTYTGKSVTYVQTRPDKWVGAKNDFRESTVTIREVNFKGEVWEAKLDTGSGAFNLAPYYTCTQDSLFSAFTTDQATLKRVFR